MKDHVQGQPVVGRVRSDGPLLMRCRRLAIQKDAVRIPLTRGSIKLRMETGAPR